MIAPSPPTSPPSPVPSNFVLCPPGYISETGYYSPLLSISEGCTPCPFGTFQNKSGQVNCTRCGLEEVAKRGQRQCEKCELGYHVSSNSSVCELCPYKCNRKGSLDRDIYCTISSPTGACGCKPLHYPEETCADRQNIERSIGTALFILTVVACSFLCTAAAC